MDISSFFSFPLFTIGDHEITLGNISALLLISAALFFLYRLFTLKFLPKYFERKEVDAKNQRTIRRLLIIVLFLSLVIGFLLSCQIDSVVFTMNDIDIKISNILLAILLFQVARLLDCFVSKIWLKDYYEKRRQELKSTSYEKLIEEAPQAAVQSVFYIIAIILILYNFNINQTIYDFGTDIAPEPLKISNILSAIFILMAARLISWMITQVALFGYFRNNDINLGSQYAINQLLKYIIFFIATLLAIEAIGLNLTVIWAGSAALLVGIGFGLQQTFNDLISGIILLFERTVEVGDFVQIDEDELGGQVRRIGWRTSDVETRNNITVIVPNSKLISENVVNWSHSGDQARFKVSVGVAYGSDTQLVKKILLDCAKENKQILKYPSPFVRFTDFGNSSLDFELLFWSHNFLRIEDVRSDLRFAIDQSFRENNITIPFPQRDVWMRSKEENKPNLMLPEDNNSTS